MNSTHSAGRLVGFLATCLLFAACAQAEQPAKVHPMMKDFMGINGHTVQVKADLYTPVCRLMRDYHPVGWDTNDDSSADTQFPLARNTVNWEDKSGKWKSFSGTPNWEEIYGGWKKAGFEIDACLQFGMKEWKSPAEDAYKYGKEFATYFGPSGKAKLVTSAEIGNEPDSSWKMDDYVVIFKNMAKGLREGDPKLKIVTGTTQAGKPDVYSLPIDIFKGLESLYDVVNVHVYSFKQGWPTWERSFPEDPNIEYLKIVQKTIDWRNENAKGKELWVTEFGYDAATKPAPKEGTFKDFIGVSDETQAQWIVRSFLVFSAMDVDRAYLYWFNDDDGESSMHGVSGITRLMNPKPSYWAMKHLYATLGEYRFSKAAEKIVGDVYSYDFVRDGNDKDHVFVVWSPTGSHREIEKKLEFPGKVVKAQRMPLTDGPIAAVDMENLKITESPVYVWVTLP